MNRAIDVAKYIINYANDNSYEISNLKLQKILYYIQAAFLMESNGEKPCFSNQIVAWLHGPVVETVYYEFSNYGGKQIPRQEYIKKIVCKNRRLEFERKKFTYDILSQQDRNIVDKVLNGLLKYDAWYLVAKTHEEEPWKNTEADEEISWESIYSYFSHSGNRRRIYGNFD